MLDASFPLPEFSAAKIGCTALGALILWNMKGRSNLKAYGISRLTNLIPVKYKRARVLTELILFLMLGTALAILLADPSTPRQAFAAGLGWTGLVAKQQTETQAHEPQKTGQSSA
jgi:hypothetical protein